MFLYATTTERLRMTLTHHSFSEDARMVSFFSLFHFRFVRSSILSANGSLFTDYFLMDLRFIGSIFYARWLKMTFFQNFLLSVNFLSEFFIDFFCWIFYINITSFWQSDFFFYTPFCLPQMFLYLFRSFVLCILAFENALFIKDSNFIILFWESITIFDFLT